MTTSPAAARPRSGVKRGQNVFVIACLAPAFVLFVVFMVYPTVDVFRMSLYRWTGFGGVRTFTGLSNFEALLGDMQFVRAFQNTVLLLVVVSILTMATGLVLAAVMTTRDLRARNFYRFALYLPSVLSIVVVAAIFSAVYAQQDGLVNGTLFAAGLDGLTRVWLGDAGVIMYSVAAAMLWQSLGYYLVLYMAGMANVPVEMYEASALDGAGPVRQFLSVTLPLIWSTVRTTLIFFIISAVNLSFVLVRAMTGGGPSGSSDVLLNYMFTQAYENTTYGYAMAIGVVVFSFSFVLALCIGRATKREVHQY